MWTKSSLKRRVRLPLISYSARTSEPNFITSFKLAPFSNKLLSLNLFGSGRYSYFPATEHATVFSPTHLRSALTASPLSAVALGYTFIRFAPAFRKISNLELVPGKGVQYVRSAGSSARITKVDRGGHTALVRLPSGVRKFFSLYGLAMEGGNALRSKQRRIQTKSGIWRSFGLKPKVRGVARNPVDHPHGGRTKAIRYPRTPWGKTTKFK